jgi:purine-nucleoside/S-methyl-5'-thioadenosine phosphorylase / adenosine deaminase
VDHGAVSLLRVASVPALEAVPGLVHGFERRLVGTGCETREAGRARVATALSGSGRLLLLKQVHGNAIERAPWPGTPEADAGFVDRTRLLVGIETADCLPILLVDPRRRTAAAIHAGWRGTAARIAEKAVAMLLAHGSRPEELLAALGPGIGPCCYEVGGELQTAFGVDAPEVFRPGPHGRLHLDVRGANVRQLLRAGVPLVNLHHVDECTRCRTDLYHSFRREGKGAGRMLNYVGWEE